PFLPRGSGLPEATRVLLAPGKREWPPTSPQQIMARIEPETKNQVRHPDLLASHRLECRLDNSIYLRCFLRNRIRPSTIRPIRVHRGHPPLGGCPLDFLEGVEALGLEDKVDRRSGLEADDEVGDVIVGLAVVEVGDGEVQALILHEGLDLV